MNHKPALQTCLRTLIFVSFWLLPMLLILSYVRGVAGNFFNSYPLITSDGFDWIFQGEALYARINNGQPIFLPVLRQPLFVIIWALDRGFRANGQIYLVVNMCAAALYSLVFTALLKKRTSLPASYIFLLSSALVFFPLNLFAAFVLCDLIAISLGLTAFYLFWEFENQRKIIFLASSLILALLAGLTKTYGLIPFLISSGIFVSHELYNRKRNGAVILSMASILLVCLLFVLITATWRSQFDYGMIPNTFSLLKLKTAMTAFYVNLWAFILIYLSPILLLIVTKFKGIPLSKYSAALLAICIVQFSLAYFYQYQDARFTFNYFVYVLLLLADRMVPRDKLSSKLILALGPLLFLLAAFGLRFEYGVFGAGIKNIKIEWAQSWIGIIANSRPKDRFRLRHFCGSNLTICSDLPVPEQSSLYRRKIYSAYVNLY